ncbi:MAG: IPT/TIG domain-containing protein, partial [Verrucomicrobia bacterium]|nr:IPT/TIG domain-containing protein [Verrucomicrobiota bacterium]
MKIEFTCRIWSAFLAASFGLIAPVLQASPSTAPVIANFFPTNGPAGTSVTIVGANLITATNVEFNGVSAGFSVFGNQLVTTVPTNATTGAIQIFTPNGATASTNVFTLTELDPPLIEDFFPASGPIGTSVAVVGKNLAGITAVWFGGVAALFSPGFANTNLTATVPTNATTGFITVVTTGGTNTSAKTFTVTATPPPIISGFEPTSGAAGTRVTISGTNLSGVTAVRFNGVEAKFTPGFFGSSITVFVP